MTKEPALDDRYLAKVQLWMQALRRRTLDYWYATTESREAAQIEAAAAAVAVAVLDEVIFGDVVDGSKKIHESPRGRIVLGLRLIRNAEVHSPVVAPLVERAMFSVPQLGYRRQFTWPTLEDLPLEYRRRTTGEPRARGPERDAYKKFVADRPVIATLLEAVAFFEAFDFRLKADRSLQLRYSFVAPLPLGMKGEELPSRPMFLDTFQLQLPDLATRSWEPSRLEHAVLDKEFDQLARRARQEVPPHGCREIRGRIVDDSGKLIGYHGLGGARRTHYRSAWAERTAQVARDIERGFRYFVVIKGHEHNLVVGKHRSVQVHQGAGNLDSVSASESRHWLDHLRINEGAPELYLLERQAVN